MNSDSNARSQARSTAGSAKTVVTSILLLSILLLSSVFLVDLSQEASAPQDNPEITPSQPLELRGPSHSQRDWQALADSTGFVDVILMLPADATTHDPLQSFTSTISTLSGQASSVDQERLIDDVRQGVKTRFSQAISGFSAHLSVESVKTLSALDSRIQIYPDLPVHAFISDNIYQVGADQLWSRTDSGGQFVTGHGVVVAVIDTGVDYTHPDIGGGMGAGYKVIGGYDFFNNDSDPMDDNGHGTHVTGIIAANGASFKGVAPDASILAYKVLGSDGYGVESNIIEAIERAIDPDSNGDISDHADIISMSLGGSGEQGDPLCMAVKNAVNAGAIVVVAAGNGGPSMGTVGSPGLAPEAITVGAVDGEGHLASFSSRGTGTALQIKPDISAPGVSILSTVPPSGTRYSSPSGYNTLSGTSMATPHVSGAAALLLQLHSDWTPAMVKSALVTESAEMTESLWLAGSGQLWIPSSADASLFASSPLFSCSHVAGFNHTLVLENSGPSSTFSLTSLDWSSLSINGSSVGPQSIDASRLSKLSISISSDGSESFILSVPMPQPYVPEGYFDGVLNVSDGARSVRISFGYAILSVLNVHVLDMGGNEVFDSDGGVWAYRVPDVGISVGARAPGTPAPPASFVVESGTYSVHSAGHQNLYSYIDPYALSSVVQVDRTQTSDVYLRMSSARQMTLKLETEEGCPIYVDHYWLYYRYVGNKNVSFHLFSTDDAISGSGMFSLPKSRTIYVSDTDTRLGIAIAGYSYSASMYDFMNRNWKHWYDVSNSLSTNFRIEATADLEYFLSWEFDGINSSTPTVLTLEGGKYSVFDTKYDLPGAADSASNPGGQLSMGTASNLYLRRDTGTSIPPLFSGMNRKVIVQGVFEEYYTPGYLRGTAFDQEFYTPDYGILVNYSYDTNRIYLPDRNFLKPLSANTESHRVGQGPFYPSVRTMISNDTLAIMHPVLRDQSGAKVVGRGIAEPDLLLFRDDSLVGTYDMSEFQRALDAVRLVSLPGAGTYRAEIFFNPGSQVCDQTKTVLGFMTPSIDLNPPEIVGLSMPMRFVSGDALDLQIEAKDDQSVDIVEAYWRSIESSPWKVLAVNEEGGGRYGSQIQTTSADNAVHLMVRISDSSGNYIEYTASNASLRQIPVRFNLTISQNIFEYRNGDSSALITGYLTDLNGNPISRNNSIPLELCAGGLKLAMILDENVASNSHSHDGTIRFEWHFNPSVVFSGPDQTVNIRIAFDLGIYEPISKTITLQSVMSSNSPPTITLESPTNGSLIASGQIVDLNIVDDGTFAASAYLDGVALSSFASPWQISTSSWSDGRHILDVTAEDDQLCTSRASYEFEVDALAPSVAITFPLDGARIPLNSILTASVNDARLSSVTYSADSKPAVPMQAPYSIDMSGWTPGQHAVTITATDMVGHSTAKRVAFEISSSSVALQLLAPVNRSVICSGTPIQFTASGNGSMTYKWCQGGTWSDLGAQTTIWTVGWLQGLHTLLINATSSLGGSDQITVAVTIDDVVPVIQLQSPSNNSYVSPTDRIIIHVQENNLMTVTWTLWGSTRSGSSPDLSISLSSYPSDGVFSIAVRATDKAGNEARENYVFKLDSSPPMLSIANIASGEVARLGIILDVSASDPYLTQVEWSLDDGQRALLASPYDINTSSFSVGWHSLQITASDASGKQTVLTVSFYLDNAAPEIGSISNTSFKSGTDLSVTANVTDDYGVGSVLLYYELANGSYASLPMILDGSSYVVLLPASVLWDGMDVYVTCWDVAGNSALGPHVRLSAAPSAPAPSSGPKSLVGFFSSMSGIALLGAAAMISSMSLFLVSKHRSRDEETPPKPSVARAISSQTLRAQPTASALPAAKARPLSRTIGQAQTARVDANVGQIAQARSAAPSLESRKPARPPTLIDSIPEMVLKSQVPRDDPEPETDYGDLIERELIIPSLKTSIFRENIKDLNPEIMKQLEELGAMCRQMPKKTLG